MNKIKLTKVAIMASTMIATGAYAIDFDDALSKKYDIYANHGTIYDHTPNYKDVSHFQQKADKQAAVNPETTRNWNLLPFHEQEINAARNRLTAALTPQNKNALPKTSATAQTKFDCWVERAEQKFDINAIAECRNAFFSALYKLENNAGRQVRVTSNYDSVGYQPFTKADLNIFFDFDSAELDASERRKIRRVADEFKKTGYDRIYVEGHADTVGDKAYNQTLSAKRANNVRQVIMSEGVASNDVSLKAEGETDLMVETKDEVREPRNRRVYLTFVE